MADIIDQAAALETAQREEALATWRHTQAHQLVGKPLSECKVCETPIPEERQRAVPGVKLCVECQSDFEHHHSRRLQWPSK